MERSVPLASIHSYRLLIAFLLMFSSFCASSMRIDLGIAIVCMVNSTAFLQNDTATTANSWKKVSKDRLSCSNISAGELLINEGYEGSILWTPKQQSIIFSASHYGGLLSAIPAGILADYFNPKFNLLIGIADMAFFTSIIPVLANWSFYSIFLTRMVIGLGEAFILPSMASISTKWFPATERSTAAAIYTSGNQIALSLVYWIGAELCSVKFLGGWPLLFYLLGLISFSWMIVWIPFASSSPSENRWISNVEQTYLERCLNNSPQKLRNRSIPWKSMIRSMPVIANVVVMFTINFHATIMQSFLPTYFRDVLFINLKKVPDSTINYAFNTLCK
uniref:MFS domain-containing protein n=1 Tax=Elaeophora elaphi TaxID=1147741 RepID=A0A0R3S7F4_9BILA